MNVLWCPRCSQTFIIATFKNILGPEINLFGFKGCLERDVYECQVCDFLITGYRVWELYRDLKYEPNFVPAIK